MHKALGRGLESLLPVSSAPVISGGENIIQIAIDKIRPNRYQPRMNFDENKLKELSESIRRHGLAQPLLVTPSAIPGEFEIIAGERRWRACKMAGLKEVSAIVKQVNDRERFQLSLIENIQREDLNPIEEAKGLKRLSDEFGLTQEELADVVGKDRSVVANLLRLLNLPLEIQESIEAGIISPGHGKILAGISDKNKQRLLAERIFKEKLTVREVEKIVSSWKEVSENITKKNKKYDLELQKLAEELQRRLGTKVKIVGKQQRGKIEIHYFSLSELERISSILKIKR